MSGWHLRLVGHPPRALKTYKPRGALHEAPGQASWAHSPLGALPGSPSCIFLPSSFQAWIPSVFSPGGGPPRDDPQREQGPHRGVSWCSQLASYAISCSVVHTLPGLVRLLRQCPFPGSPPGLAFSWAGLRHRNAPAQDAGGKVSTGPCFPSSLPGTGLGTGAPFISAGEETEAQVWLPNLEAGADHQTSEAGYTALAPNTKAGRKGHTAAPLSPLPGMESLGPSLQIPPNLRETKTAGHHSAPSPLQKKAVGGPCQPLVNLHAQASVPPVPSGVPFPSAMGSLGPQEMVPAQP